MKITDFIIALSLFVWVVGVIAFVWTLGGILITDLKNRWRLKMWRKKWKN